MSTSIATEQDSLNHESCGAIHLGDAAELENAATVLFGGEIPQACAIEIEFLNYVELNDEQIAGAVPGQNHCILPPCEMREGLALAPVVPG
ncbi:hypothetical protein V6N13_127201 [Hibiscus sabdariffa]|uniref:Uncharacterized protein n=1 Tax=Hibiscus sabdariffa TaxID=183260 RepID=A0ABR2RD75_9ROSI